MHDPLSQLLERFSPSVIKHLIGHIGIIPSRRGEPAEFRSKPGHRLARGSRGGRQGYRGVISAAAYASREDGCGLGGRWRHRCRARRALLGLLREQRRRRIFLAAPAIRRWVRAVGVVGLPPWIELVGGVADHARGPPRAIKEERDGSAVAARSARLSLTVRCSGTDPVTNAYARSRNHRQTRRLAGCP